MMGLEHIGILKGEEYHARRKGRTAQQGEVAQGDRESCVVVGRDFVRVSKSNSPKSAGMFLKMAIFACSSFSDK